MRISLQLAAGYFLIVGLASWFVLEVFVEEVKPGVRDTMEDTLVDTANLIAELAAPVMSASGEGSGDAGARFAAALERYRARPVDAGIWQHRKRNLDLRIYLTDARGIVVHSTEPDQIGRDYSRWNDVYLTLQGRYGARSTPVDPEHSSSSVMHVAAPVLRDGRLLGVVSVAKSGDSVAPIVESSKAKIRERGLLLLIITALIGALFTWHLTQAIERLRRYARQVTDGQRVSPPRSGARELAELADALGEMRERLEGKQYVERYLHTLTHELKSPLAAIRGAAELLSEPDMPEAERRRFLSNIGEQSQRLAQIVDRLLELARVEQLQVLHSRERFDLAAVAEEVAGAAETLAARRGIRIELNLERPARVEGDRFLLWRALANLLDNALAFSPDDGLVRIVLTVRPRIHGQTRSDGVEICVIDQGPGIPDYAWERVFERFFSLPRPSAGPKGTGLGLSFVREVAALHRGIIDLRPAAPTGLCARFWLPCVPR